MGQTERSKKIIQVEGENLELLAERAIHWPSRRTLIVSDLHWGKSETFRQSGIPIPASLLESDLERLSDALRGTKAERLLVLGDLIHGKLGLNSTLTERISEWRSSFAGRLVSVRGNHDRSWKQIPVDWKVEWTEAFVEGGFYFSHLPKSEGSHFAWAGHLHPTYRLKVPNDSLRLPCFHIGRKMGILPAFSDFTRGVVMGTEEGDRVFVIAEGNVIEVPV